MYARGRYSRARTFQNNFRSKKKWGESLGGSLFFRIFVIETQNVNKSTTNYGAIQLFHKRIRIT